MNPWPALSSAVALLVLTACSNEQAPVELDTHEASRVVTLAPHLAELVFAAGAGDRLVGVSAYTDYPEEAAELPIVSDAFTVDLELMRVLEPDLVLAWASGMPASTIEELKSTGLNVVTIETTSLEDVAAALHQIGSLTGQGQQAGEAAAAYEASLSALRDEFSSRRPVTVFFQVSSRPLYTVNGRHFISELLTMCGGANVFAELSELAPAIDVEAVLAADPEAIIASGSADSLAVWERFDTLRANQYGNRLTVEAAHLARASPRLDSAGRELCDVIDVARARLPAVP